MNKFKNFALKRPFLFGIVLMILYALLTALAYPVHYLFPENEAGQLYGDAVTKFLVFVVFLVVLWRFGWIQKSGITRVRNMRIWLVIAGLLVYLVVIQLYAFTGSFTIAFPKSPLGYANLAFAFSTSLVEETIVRGLVLIAMILAWGSTKQGKLKAILFSSLLFGIFHLFNIMVRPVGVVLAQALIVTMPGIFYATIVLAYRSLWPAIVIHWFGNAAVNIKLIGNDNYQETFTMWIIFAISLIPLIAYSAYLILRLPQSDEILNMDASKPYVSMKESVLS
jgi:membrane protease YdiL (CAAX protease family)